MEMNKELLEKAKTAKSAEELLALAKENEVEMTEESAKAYFELMQAQTKTGELSDEELDNVSGGGCHTSDGRLVTTIYNECDHWVCEEHKEKQVFYNYGQYHSINKCPHPYCKNYRIVGHCNNCYYCVYEDALWLCNHPERRG